MTWQGLVIGQRYVYKHWVECRDNYMYLDDDLSHCFSDQSTSNVTYANLTYNVGPAEIMYSISREKILRNKER